jgi:hypothetical protein
MPIGLATHPDIASNIDQVRLVYNGYGRCWRMPGYAYCSANDRFKINDSDGVAFEYRRASSRSTCAGHPSAPKTSMRNASPILRPAFSSIN